MKNTTIKKVLCIIMIASWMLVIFSFSSLQAEESSAQSTNFTKSVVENTVRCLTKSRSTSEKYLKKTSFL